jgi:hypothetical protein
MHAFPQVLLRVLPGELPHRLEAFCQRLALGHEEQPLPPCSGATPRAQVDGQEVAVRQVTALLTDLVVEHQTRLSFAIEPAQRDLPVHHRPRGARRVDLRSGHLPADWWMGLYAFCGDGTGGCQGGKACCSISSSCRACLQGSLTVGEDRSVTLCLTAPAPTAICPSGCFERSILGHGALLRARPPQRELGDCGLWPDSGASTIGASKLLATKVSRVPAELCGLARVRTHCG